MMDGTIEDRQAGIDRLKEINEEAKAQEIESQITSQAELDALKQNGYKLEQSRLAEHASEVITKAKEMILRRVILRIQKIQIKIQKILIMKRKTLKIQKTQRKILNLRRMMTLKSIKIKKLKINYIG